MEFNSYRSLFFARRTAALVAEQARQGKRRRALLESNPHSYAPHLIDRFRQAGRDTLELVVTIADPKANTKPSTGKRTFKLGSSALDVKLCSHSEMQDFQDEVTKSTTKAPQK